ncbi:hypothetical protein O181_057965 [Austropuccinia psidii MF-1]|uniref:Integrase catalytic domain-containing protein n=1 Tax=Austropuccinia psidii MF-1 TaxID=1389203 RepID=A0A9Q3E8S1_9BASI|nr:hypothetical protein [Austropuccinia psidii MF-1]
MPLKEATDNHDVVTKGSQSDLSRVLDAVDALTSKVQLLQLELDFHKQVCQSPHKDINPTLRRFFEDPLSLHFSVNPRKPILTFDSRKFLALWEALSTTISFVYKLKDQPILVFLNNTDPNTSAIFDELQHQCDKSTHFDKLEVIRQFISLLNHLGPSNTPQWLGKHQEIYSLLLSWQVSLSKLCGLFLQDNINKSTFDVVLHNHLGRLDSPATFEYVSEAIQAAETAAMSVVLLALVDHDASVLAVRYFRPNSSSSVPMAIPHHFYQATAGPPNQSPPQHLPDNMIEKAAAFKGRGQTKPLIEQFGDLCLYFKKCKHWYADCHKFWADVQAGRAVAPTGMRHRPLLHQPKNCSSKGKDPQVYSVKADVMDNGCLVDSAANIHVSGDNPDFVISCQLMWPIILRLASSGHTSHLMAIGSLRILMPNGMLVVDNVYYCQAICSAILSLGWLIEDGFHPLFTCTCLRLLSKNNVLFNTSYIRHCWYLIRTPHAANAISKSPLHSAEAWNEHLGHGSTTVVREFLTRQPFLLTLRDHVSTFILTAPLKYWKDVPSHIVECVKFLYGCVGKYPTQLRTDNAGKYSAALEANLWSMGTEWVPVEPYQPDFNGKAERVNRTLGDMATKMLNASNFPSFFWSYTYSCATKIHNRLPNTRTAPMTPMEQLLGIKPDPAQIYPFGARVIVHVPSEKRDKLEERRKECFLLTLPKSGHGWIFYDPRTKCSFQYSFAVFLDYQCLPVLVPKKKGGLLFILNHLKLGEVPTDAIAKKECAVMSTLHQPSNLLISKTIGTVFASDYKSEWQLAAEDKLWGFEQHDVWTPIFPTKGMKVLGGKWVFDVKRHADGIIECFKSRYVARGFSQRLGINCFDVYAPTAGMNSLRLLLAMKVQYAMSLAAFDVWLAYLYSPIEEDVCVQAPVELRPEWNGKVMKLKKALYGTEQAARCWWKFSLGIMSKMGFEVSEVKPSLYMLRKDNERLIVWIHVDDGIVVGSSDVIAQQSKLVLSGALEVHWSDDVSKIVGLFLTCEGHRLRINQHFLADQIVSAYQRPVVHKFNQLPDKMLTSNNSDAIDAGVFQSTIGSLMYLSNGTRPNISYAVHLLARFAANPGLCHWQALDHLIGYLSRHPHLSLSYGDTSEGFELWADATWGGEHQWSTLGYIIKVFGNVVAWGSKRQTVVAIAACVAEYVALLEAAQLLSLLRLVSESILGTQPLSIYCDNGQQS